jgi:hypothetical protein
MTKHILSNEDLTEEKDIQSRNLRYLARKLDKAANVTEYVTVVREIEATLTVIKMRSTAILNHKI